MIIDVNALIKDVEKLKCVALCIIICRDQPERRARYGFPDDFNECVDTCKQKLCVGD